jgi:NAD(P) transhydrogenase subunit beta
VIGLSLLFGIMAVIPIGGADMPVVISLLNSYSGLAACAAGFAINNNILIVAGSSGGCFGHHLDPDHVQGDEPFAHQRACSRGFASVSDDETTEFEGEIKPISADDAYYILEAAT